MTEQRKPTIDCLPLIWKQIRAIDITEAHEPDLWWALYDEKNDIQDHFKTFEEVADYVKDRAQEFAESNDESLNGALWHAAYGDQDICDELGKEAVFIRRAIGFEVVNYFDDMVGNHSKDFYYTVTVEGQTLAKEEAAANLIAYITHLEAEIARKDEALTRIATTKYCQYDGNAPFISAHTSGYALGVSDGHRLAASWAREALAPSEHDSGKDGE